MLKCSVVNMFRKDCLSYHTYDDARHEFKARATPAHANLLGINVNLKL